MHKENHSQICSPAGFYSALFLCALCAFFVPSCLILSSAQQPTATPAPPVPATVPRPPQPPATGGPAAAIQAGVKPAGQPGAPLPPGVPPGARPGVPPGGPAGAPGAPGVGKGPAAGKQNDSGAPTSVVPPPPNPIVEKATNLPPPPESVPEELPEGGVEETKIKTLIYKQAAIEKVLDAINKQSGAAVKAMEAVAGQKVDVKAQNKSVKEVLDDLIAGKDWTWIRRENGTYEIWDKPSFIEKELRKRVIRRIFPLRFVNAADVQPAIEGVKSEVGAVAANPRTNEIIVTDLPDKVALVESILKEIDVQLYTRAFRIKYAKFEDVQSHLEPLKSPPGLIQADPQNRMFVVTDTFERIKQMEQLIELMDIDQPIKVYYLNSIGLEAADANDLIDKIIKPLATPDALIEFNQTQATLLVKDIPEVHDRILEVLMAMDQTPKQIWIEGEILEVRKDYSFTFGTEWTYSPNMPAAFAKGLVKPFATDSTFNPTSMYPVISSGSAGLRVINLAGNLKAELNAAMSDDQTRILLQPRALVRNRQPVTVQVITNTPQAQTFFNPGFTNTTVNNNGVNGFSSTGFTSVQTGITLALTPTINNRGLVEMDVQFTNSSPTDKTVLINGQANSAVQTDEQTIQTTLIIPSGETRALGGLIGRTSTHGTSGIPFFSKLPILGPLFGVRKETKKDANLIFFLTPTIVNEKPQVEAVESAVNQPARDLSAEANAEGAVPPPINPVPEKLAPFLKQERPDELFPEGKPKVSLPEEDARTTEGLSLSAMRGEERPLPELKVVEDMLHDEPPPPVGEAPKPLDISGPGASLLSSGKSAVGPSGVIATTTTAAPATAARKPPTAPTKATPTPTTSAKAKPTPRPPLGQPGSGIAQPSMAAAVPALPQSPGATETKH